MLRRSLLAATFATPIAGAFKPAAAQAAGTRLRIAMQFVAPVPIPEPRAQRNGWYTSNAGISETLLALDHEMRLVPRIAESYRNTAPDTWVLQLRPGITFHDGSPVDAAAVKASFDGIGKSDETSNPRLLRLLDLAEIQADGMTVTFRTKQPNAAFPYALTEPSAAVVKQGTAAMPVIATGPFRFVSSDPNKRLVGRAYDRYWGGKPSVDEVVIDSIPDAQTARLALEAGNLDLVINYPEPDFAKLAKEGKGQRFAAPTTRLFFFAANTKKGPLADKRIRQALSLAIDRDVIVDVALGGVGGTRANSVFPATMASWVNPAVKLPYDVARAKALLAEAGVRDTNGDRVMRWDGKPLVLRIGIYEGRAAFKPTVEIVQAMFQALGIRSEIRMGEYEANNVALRAGEIDLHLQAWGTAPQGDPGYFPETLLKTGAGLNDGEFSNARLDELMQKVRTEFDQAARLKMVLEIQEIIAAEMPILPMFHSNQTSVGNGKVVGFRIYPTETYLVTPALGLAR